jgi:hypothetical protein
MNNMTVILLVDSKQPLILFGAMVLLIVVFSAVHQYDIYKKKKKDKENKIQ